MATEDLTEALSSPKSAYHYARNVINGPWPLGEAVIAQSARYSYLYARNVVGRFPLGETAIAQTSYWAFLYARDVVGRFPLGEPAIAQSPQWALQYCHEITGNRLPAAESVIAADPNAARLYFNRFRSQFTEHEKLLWLLKI